MERAPPSTDRVRNPPELPYSIDPGDFDPHIQLVAEIAAVHRQWQAAMDEELGVHGLTHVRWLTLWRIAESPSAPNQTDLARKVGIESSTLVRQLDILEQQGLIERIVDTDRRVRRIRLTPAAVPMIGLLQQVAVRLIGEMVGDFDQDDVVAGLSLLRRMRARLDGRLAGPASSR